MTTQPKAILFDFGGTLDYDGVDWFRRLHRAICAAGDALEWDLFEEAGDWAANEIGRWEDTPQCTMAQTVGRLCEQTHARLGHLHPTTPTRWDPAAIAHAFVAESEIHLNRNRDILRQMAKKFRLGCISNNWGNTAGWCSHYQFSEFFEVMVDSTLVGAMKPARIIFQTALDQLQLPGQACIYVGDRFDFDVAGAHAAGLVPIWITNGSYNSSVDENLQHRKIGALNELLTLDGLNPKA